MKGKENEKENNDCALRTCINDGGYFKQFCDGRKRAEYINLARKNYTSREGRVKRQQRKFKLKGKLVWSVCRLAGNILQVWL
ncbi:hypothetical protein D1155_12635 [Anaerotruncus sp. 80]|uniref:Uncharacterized protein n=1 Tax=Anaerotruncus colihominis TaxID=169435 RepID=A0A845QM39_9FIRM|nr:hypothetical protein [Anaerotruncus colihominis]NCF03149.1 hypothetical protein [Anaerotruncus sp. 80]